MTYVVQLEENGVVHFPDDVLESLQIKPGAKLLLENQPEDHRVVLSVREHSPQSRVYEDRGVLVYRALDRDPSYDLLRQVNEMREERMKQVMEWTTQEQEDDDLR